MITPVEKLKVLVTTKPGRDGFGDLYSAYRLTLLLKELHPDWDVALYALRTIPSRFCRPEDLRFIEIINLRCGELGLRSSDMVLEFNPDIHVSVAGWYPPFMAKHEEFNPELHCREVKYSLHVQEYNSQPSGSNMFMRVSALEKMAMPPIAAIGLSLDEEIKGKIHNGDYYFAYGRKSTSVYIQKILETSPDRPIYVVIPGLKELEGLDAINSVHYDINTGEEIKKVGEKIDVVIIRGVVPQNVFMSLLYNTSKPHVMVTGDMSFTEALDAGKIPFLDWPTADGMTARLYGREYRYIFYDFVEPVRCGDGIPILDSGMKLLSQPDEIRKIKEHLFKNYRAMSESAENTAREIEEFLASARPNPPGP